MIFNTHSSVCDAFQENILNIHEILSNKTGNNIKQNEFLIPKHLFYSTQTAVKIEQTNMKMVAFIIPLTFHSAFISSLSQVFQNIITWESELELYP